jgi:hypothetical protein
MTKIDIQSGATPVSLVRLSPGLSYLSFHISRTWHQNQLYPKMRGEQDNLIHRISYTYIQP